MRNKSMIRLVRRKKYHSQYLLPLNEPAMSTASSSESSDADISWRLFFLYVFLFLTSIVGIILCTILVFLLKLYDVFHVNFRTILWNVLMCILVNNVLQILRPILLLGQYIFGNEERGRFDDIDTSDCFDLNSLPSVFCIFLSFSGILLAIERLYATMNYAKYEYENFTKVLNRIYLGLWMMFVGSAYWNLADFQFNFDYFKCMLIQIDKDPIKTHWHILFTVIVQAVCLIIFSIVVTLNREKQAVYIKHYYNSLSPRFQIGENIKATRLLVLFTLLLFFSLDFLLIHRYLQHNYFAKRNVSWEDAMFFQETGLMIMPLFSVIMPLVFILKSAVFLTRARMLIKDVLVSKLLAQEDSKSAET
ncbi:Serpentine receptor class alpha/beta-14 [Aphelenchoides bicaudatus]|nr:Serpentine receptor class alpha/beta-14 [Aphelenchoides bicaudatus]